MIKWTLKWTVLLTIVVATLALSIISIALKTKVTPFIWKTLATIVILYIAVALKVVGQSIRS